MTNDNAKNPDFKPPMHFPGVKPEQYGEDINSGNGSAAPANPDTHDGAKGFSPQLGGAGIAGKTNTSSFDAGSNEKPLSNDSSNAPAGQEENGRMRQPTTSAVAHINKEKPE